mmetsp:Transcript_21803/g.52724  ORF Transcript_21803/g.52724 Transcript_21803/m.52724 type:complete len:246 (+) Transcript_21803:724-1461(+)
MLVGHGLVQVGEGSHAQEDVLVESVPQLFDASHLVGRVHGTVGDISRSQPVVVQSHYALRLVSDQVGIGVGGDATHQVLAVQREQPHAGRAHRAFDDGPRRREGRAVVVGVVGVGPPQSADDVAGGFAFGQGEEVRMQVPVFAGGGRRGRDGDEVAVALIASYASRSASFSEESLQRRQARYVDLLFRLLFGGFAEQSYLATEGGLGIAAATLLQLGCRGGRHTASEGNEQAGRCGRRVESRYRS